jgi:RND family efflux transporter MFP subunit
MTINIGKRSALILVGAAVLALIVILRLWGKDARADKGEETSPRPVAVALAELTPISDTVALSGEFRPFQEVDVHAKVAGYIRKIYVDVGDHVKTGQTLAILEVPELDAQLQGAEAAIRRNKDAIRRVKSDMDRAESLHRATHLDYVRLKQASEARPGLIAEQELDYAMAKDKEGEAQISADEAAFSEAQNQLDVAFAEQKQLSAMSDYTRIVAPFNGVITKRNVDTGTLVQAGTSSNTQALPVVSVAQTDLFRLTLPVAESAVPMIRLGTTVTVHVQALNRDFEGKVARFADSVNQETRTMHTEVDVPNANGTIVGGMYAEVKLTLAKKDNALAVPIQALNRNGSETTVLVVNSQDRIEERDVRLGMEGASQVEVISGLNPKDRVVIGSRSDFRPGERVNPKVIAQNREAQF